MDERPVPRPRPRPAPRPLPPLAPEPLAPAQARFVPDRRYTALAAGGAFGALLAVLITDDAGGRLLAGIAGLLLLGYVITDLVFSPRLIASADGLVVNTPFHRIRLAWPDVDEVRAETRFRRGLRSTTLEVDAGAVLAVFNRRTLGGVEPVAAAELIEAFRPITR